MAEAAAVNARKRLSALEERVPWHAVKKLWMQRRNDWVAVVQGTLSCRNLAHQLMVLESMLKSETLAPAWAVQKLDWKQRASVCNSAAALDTVVAELEQAILWQRILVAPDGRPLTAEEIAHGGTATQIPPPLSVAQPADPPEGIPRMASRILMLLHSMGANRYDPKVVVQLLDFIHGWTAAVLLDASAHARMRVLGPDPASRTQQTFNLALQPEPPVEEVDLALAVRGRVEQHPSRAAREVVAQQASETNIEPMPILPRRPTVALPTELSQCQPAARELIERGMEVDEEDEEDEEEESWWEVMASELRGRPHARDAEAAHAPVKREAATKERAADAKRLRTS